MALCRQANSQSKCSTGHRSLTSHLSRAACWCGSKLCTCPCAGQPHLGVDVDQIEPPAVVAAAAAGLFALGKPLTGSRSLPKVNLDEQYDNVGRIGRIIATVSRSAACMPLFQPASALNAAWNSNTQGCCMLTSAEMKFCAALCGIAGPDHDIQCNNGQCQMPFKLLVPIGMQIYEASRQVLKKFNKLFLKSVAAALNALAQALSSRAADANLEVKNSDPMQGRLLGRAASTVNHGSSMTLA